MKFSFWKSSSAALALATAASAFSPAVSAQPAARTSADVLERELAKCDKQKDENQRSMCISNAERIAEAFGRAQQRDQESGVGQAVMVPGGRYRSGQVVTSGGRWEDDRQHAQLCTSALENVSKTDYRIQSLTQQVVQPVYSSGGRRLDEFLTSGGNIVGKLELARQLKAARDERKFFNDQAELYCNATRGGTGSGNVRGPQIPVEPH